MYTFSELRVNLKDALDRSRLSPVKIFRRKEIFYIVNERDYKKMLIDKIKASTNHREQDNAQDNLPKAKTNEFIPKPPDPVNGYECCNRDKPCKHWRWNDIDAVYQNELTGKIKSPID